MSPDGEEKTSRPDGALTPLDRLIARGGKAMSLLFLLSAAIIAFEVVARYVFDSPTTWAHETTTFICALCFAYGGCHCLAQNSHIRIVLLYQHADRTARRTLDIILSVFSAILCGILTIAAWTMVRSAFFAPWGDFRMETSGSAWDPTFPAWVKLALFLALLVMTIQCLWQLLHHLRRDPND